jgi:glycosyltransferase involved in cell wall biosynthesis
MKIIGLLPFKNEEKFLPTYLSNVQPVCDEIIAIDDNSTDNSRQIMEDAGVIVKGYEDTENLKGGWTCGLIRQHLFNYGREAGGTHFVCLDADETFTSNFVPIARDIISQLQPGEKAQLQWLALWKSYTSYRDDHTVWSRNFKDFIVHDHPSLTYEYQYMCEGRTIGWHDDNTLRRLEVEHGAVLHYQFSCFNNFLLKQAWCQVGELVQQGPSALGAINAKYHICYQDQNVGMREMPQEWIKGIPLPDIPNFDPEWKEENFLRKNLLPDIYRHFDEYGVEYFKGLNIWQIPQLRERYING